MLLVKVHNVRLEIFAETGRKRLHVSTVIIHSSLSLDFCIIKLHIYTNGVSTWHKVMYVIYM